MFIIIAIKTLKQSKLKQTHESQRTALPRQCSFRPLLGMMHNVRLYITAQEEEEGLGKTDAIWILLSEQNRPCLFCRDFKV